MSGENIQTEGCDFSAAAPVDNDYENVLLLAMSTLFINKDTKMVSISQSKYADIVSDGNKFCKDASELYSGYGQMEGLTKHAIAELYKENQKFDRIIIVASDDTLKDKDFPKEKYESDQTTDAKNLQSILKPKNYSINAVDFFKERIKRFISGTADEVKGTSFANNGKTKEFCVPESGFYSEEEKNRLFKVVRCEHSESGKDVSGIYFEELIRKIKGEKKKPVRLVMHMTGGFRSTFSNIDAVMQLLEMQGVSIYKRYSTDYNSANEVNQIKEVSKEYKAYDLISAMTSFYQFADGNELEKYFDSSDDLATKKLINIIKKISDNIRLCDMIGFDNSIDELNTFHNDPDGKLDQTSQIRIVYENIVDDYKQMLDNPDDHIPKIEWCVRKGMVQQALTIIESMMPKQIFSSDVFFLDLKAHCKKEQRENDETVTVEDLINKLKKESLKNLSWKNNINLLFDDWVCRYFDKNDLDIDGLDCEASMCEVYENLRANTSDRMEEMNKSQNKNKSQYKWNKITEYKLNNKKIPFESKLEDESTKIQFLMMMRLHRELKNQRNLANHASSEEGKLPLKQIVTMIGLYIQLAKELKISSAV